MQHTLPTKFFLTLSVSLLLSATGLFAQTFTGNVTINSQTDLDNFEPAGGGTYTQISGGSLLIEPTGGVLTDFSNLADLDYIQLDLTIVNYDANQTIANPLEELTSLTDVRSIVIGNDNPGNTGITSVSSPNLSLVRGRVEIENNVSVTSVSLPSLTTVRNGSFLIRDMDNLSTLFAPQLATVGASVVLNNLNDLVNLSGLTRLGDIGVNATITNNDNLTSITSLGRLGVNGAESGGRATYDLTNLRIANNPDLSNINDLQTTVSTVFVLNNNTGLQSVGDNIVLGPSMDEITINNNPQITSLGNIFDGDPTQVVSFTARNNTALNTTGGQLLNVTGNLDFQNNDALTRLFNFESTTALTGALVIVNNELVDFRLVSSNTRLGNLQSVGDSIRIVNNPGLSRLNGLASLQSARKLEFRNNGLNGGLSNLDDLVSLTTLTDELFITGNPNLGNCCELACDVFVNGQAVDGTNASVFISGNTGGCENKPTFTTFCAEPTNNDGATGCFEAAPVEFLTFTGELADGFVELSWATATESNNSHFQVERSVAGGPYVAIGRVDGVGDSQQQTDYVFADEDYASTVNYYRLRQIDFDGTEAFSGIVAVDAGAKVAAAFVMYPNPTTTAGVTVQLNGDWNTEELTIEVYSASGQRVLHNVTSASRVLLPTGNLRAGTYAVRVTAGSRTLTRRLVVR